MIAADKKLILYLKNRTRTLYKEVTVVQHITPIPIGVEFYKQMISEGYYYIDKTLLIRDLLAQKNTVTLFTRPRRFGKTLSQNMLRTFFEKEVSLDGTLADNSIYFQGKKIMAAGEEYTKHMGQYPVISLSLKSAKQPTYEISYEKLQREITKEYTRHSYVLNGNILLPSEKKEFLSVMEKTASLSEYSTALQFLSECLEKYHKQKVIILLDEYDVPLENAYFNGFYDYKEDYYHGFTAGLLKHNGKYIIKSNRESGLGRYDLILKTKRIRKGRAIILEFKLADNIHGMEKGCMDALEQIEKFHYDNELLEEGYTDISKYGICFYKKECLVMK